MNDYRSDRIGTGQIGQLMRLRAQCGPDEKVVEDNGMAVIRPKTKLDYIMDRLHVIVWGKLA